MTLSAEYVRQRRVDPDMLVRDVGLAIAGTIGRDLIRILYRRGLDVDVPMDSEEVREHMAAILLEELERAGYAVTFVGDAR